MSYQIGVAEDIGSRENMEDAYSIDQNFFREWALFGGVYDGHGDFGISAAWHCMREIPNRLKAYLERGMTESQAFVRAYERTSDEFVRKESGACAANFLLNKEGVFVANAGDCEIVITRQDEIISLTEIHNLDSEEEVQRVSKYGDYLRWGRIDNGINNIAVTRAIGDKDFKGTGLVAIPHTRYQKFKKDEKFLVAATDGLFGVLRYRQILETVRESEDPQVVANLLKEAVLSVNSRGKDNVAIVVVKI